MISRISMALFFLFYALTALLHLPLGGTILAIIALVAGIALLAGQ